MVKYYKLDVASIPVDKICTFIGKRGQGKTTAMKYVLSKMKHKLYNGIVFSPTEAVNGTWSEHVPDLFVHEHYQTDMLERFITRQKNLCLARVLAFERKHRRRATKHERETFLRAPPAFVILEDCFYKKEEMNKDSALRKLFMNGRHYNIFAMITLQYLLDLDTRMRGNIDYIFFSKEDNPDVKRKLHRYYFGVYPRYSEFDKMFTRLTANRGCAVICTTSVSNNINENVFWMQSDPNVQFKVGSLRYREYGRRHIDFTYQKKQLEEALGKDHSTQSAPHPQASSQHTTTARDNLDHVELDDMTLNERERDEDTTTMPPRGCNTTTVPTLPQTMHHDL